MSGHVRDPWQPLGGRQGPDPTGKRHFHSAGSGSGSLEMVPLGNILEGRERYAKWWPLNQLCYQETLLMCTFKERCGFLMRPSSLPWSIAGRGILL